MDSVRNANVGATLALIFDVKIVVWKIRQFCCVHSAILDARSLYLALDNNHFSWECEIL